MKGFLSQLFEVACPPQALAKSLGFFCNDDKDAPAKEAQRENTLQQVSAGFFQVLASLYFTAGVRWILPGAGLAVFLDQTRTQTD